MATDRDLVDNSYFDPICFVSSWKCMSTELSSFVLQIPNIEEIIASNTYSSVSFIPQTETDNVSSMSGKRQRSAGDTSAGGGVSKKQNLKSKRKPCHYCGKFISGRTKHGISACEKYNLKHNLNTVAIASNNVLSPQRLKLRSI